MLKFFCRSLEINLSNVENTNSLTCRLNTENLTIKQKLSNFMNNMIIIISTMYVCVESISKCISNKYIGICLSKLESEENWFSIGDTYIHT